MLAPSGSSPIGSNGSSAANNLAAGMTQINRLRLSICAALPASVYGVLTPQRCFETFFVVVLAGGSLNLTGVVAGGSFSSPSAASSTLGSAFSSGTPLDGVSVTSTSVSTSGFTSSGGSSSSGTNLGLILGLTIPLVLLRTFLFTQLS